MTTHPHLLESLAREHDAALLNSARTRSAAITQPAPVRAFAGRTLIRLGTRLASTERGGNTLLANLTHR